MVRTLQEIYEALPRSATPEQLALIGIIHTNEINLEIAQLQNQPKVKAIEIDEEPIIQLPEFIYTRAICRRRTPCSLDRTLKDFRRAMATELQTKGVGASMLTWAIAQSIPDEGSILKEGTKYKAISQATSWRNASKSVQREAYQEICLLKEFTDVLAPLHEHFKDNEKYEFYNSPLVQALAAECELDAKAIVANPKGGPTESAIRLMNAAYRERAADKTAVIADLARLRPQWLAKVNAIEERTKMAQAKWLEETRCIA